MCFRGREKESGRNESERRASHATTITAIVLLAACGGKSSEPPAQAAKPTDPRPLVIAPIDGGVDAAPSPRRWLEVAFFDALGAVVHRESSAMFQKCFDRSNDRGYAMLFLVNETWTPEDANGLERETIACLKDAMDHDDPRAEKAARVYVVFR